VREEVQARAWEQIGQAGASALSLKAIATQMGMTAPALYRYYASRDELLTQLILSTYRDLAELTEAAAAAAATTPMNQLTAIAQTLRRWAVANPQRYLLLYGTPVPGYHAPPEATELAKRIFAPILDGFAALTGDPNEDADSPSFRRSVTFWTRLHGVLSLELAGHFAGMNVDTERLFADEINCLVRNSGDPAAAPGADAVRDITDHPAAGRS
jgi:AcrR family transcriptional regulator